MHIAASHVLHRTLMPRHPPTALNNLTTTNQHTQHTPQTHTHNPKNKGKEHTSVVGGRNAIDQMLASTIQFSNTTPTTTPTTTSSHSTEQNRFDCHSDWPTQRHSPLRVLPQDPTGADPHASPSTPTNPFHTSSRQYSRQRRSTNDAHQ